MIFGIIYFFISAYIARKLRLLGLIIATVGAAMFFKTPYAVMIFGLSLSMALGRPTSVREAVEEAPMIASQYGTLFDIVGWILVIGGFIALVTK